MPRLRARSHTSPAKRAPSGSPSHRWMAPRRTAARKIVNGSSRNPAPAGSPRRGGFRRALTCADGGGVRLSGNTRSRVAGRKTQEASDALGGDCGLTTHRRGHGISPLHAVLPAESWSRFTIMRHAASPVARHGVPSAGVLWRRRPIPRACSIRGRHRGEVLLRLVPAPRPLRLRSSTRSHRRGGGAGGRCVRSRRRAGGWAADAQPVPAAPVRGARVRAGPPGGPSERASSGLRPPGRAVRTRARGSGRRW